MSCERVLINRFSIQNKQSVLIVVEQELMILIIFKIVLFVEAQELWLRSNKSVLDSSNSSKQSILGNKLNINILDVIDVMEKEKFIHQLVEFANKLK